MTPPIQQIVPDAVSSSVHVCAWAEAFISGRAVNLVYSECKYIYALCGHLLIVCYYFHAGVSRPLKGSSCC